MTENGPPSSDRKHIVSLRLSAGDHARIKDIAKRLRVRESDVFRFAIKATLAKLAPLHDPNVRGADVMPVFAECGAELANYFDLDGDRLDAIINGGLVDHENRVPPEDIDLIAMSGMPEHYLYARLAELTKKNSRHTGLSNSLREYLNEKYVDQGPSEFIAETPAASGRNTS